MQGGLDVLLYRVGPAGGVEFLGLGRPTTLTFDGGAESDLAACQIRDVRPFANPVPAGPDATWEAGEAEISDQRFADIVARGGRVVIGAEEAAAPFDDGMDRLLVINRQVLERWNYRYAITGERYPGATGTHDELQVVSIRPLALGGPLHVRNCLPMVKAAADAWLRGKGK